VERFWQYINDVKQHRILTNRYVQLAITRFEKDYKQSKEDPDYPFYFDENAGQRVVRFLESLKLYREQWAGSTLSLEPWQVFIIGNIYSWKRKDTKKRKYTKAFIYVARKNGKTTLLSGLLLWDILTTKGGEAYCAATKRDQAKIAYGNIKEFIKQNEGLSKRLKVYRSSSRIVHEALASKIEALSADYDSMDGLDPSCVIIDECSAMKSYGIIKVLQSGTYSRPEPLLVEITSGGDNMYSVGHLEYERSVKVLEGAIEADDYFTVLYCLDEKDDWRNEKVYQKANPNLGISVSLEALIKARDEALQQPSLEGEFRVKNLNQWVSPMSSWISSKTWNKAVKGIKETPISESMLKGALAVGAVDLSKRYDFTVFTKYFYLPTIKKFYARHRFYIPEKQVEDKMKTDSPMIRKWIEEGRITATKGEVIDYDCMYADIRKDLEDYKIQEIAFDPYNAVTLMKEIGPLVDLVEYPQNMKSMSPASKSWEASVMGGDIIDDNPVMKWMVSNCSIYTDANGNIKPRKDSADNSSPKRIDGVVTSIMSYWRLKTLIDDGVDMRTAEEIRADMEKMLEDLPY
jgi:phage terminase large subunit-like protein